MIFLIILLILNAIDGILTHILVFKYGGTEAYWLAKIFFWIIPGHKGDVIVYKLVFTILYIGFYLNYGDRPFFNVVIGSMSVFMLLVCIGNWKQLKKIRSGKGE